MPNNSDSTRSNRQHAFYNNPKIRAYFYQFALLAGLVYFFYAIVSNTIHNMEIRGIKSGFDFLSTTAGFDILMSLIPFDATYSYGRTFVVGLLNTLLVSIIGIFFATLIGFLVGVSYFSHNWLVKKSPSVTPNSFAIFPHSCKYFSGILLCWPPCPVPDKV